LKSVEDDTLAQDLLKRADMVVDLTMEGFIHTPLIGDMLAAGTRVLFAADPPEVLLRNMPKIEDKQRVLDGAALIRSSSTLTVTSPAGTELVADLRDSNPGFQCGFADEPGRWDHWPSTMVLCWPKTSHGRIVLQAGDVLLPFKTFVRDDVVLEIADGRIDKITGGADARLLEMFLDDSEDEESRFLSHMGWGLMEGADWFALPLYNKENIMGMDARGLAGNFLFSTGPHPFMGRDTPYHLDIPMRGCDVTLDDTPVVRGGKLLSETTR
jgi:2,5-dihydroxypyridine 5,6-dioxygenase